jgi:F-type H+-transporting ATPase subunit gamma
MALQAKLIKSKIKAVSNVGKITKAMEKVSAVKMRKAVSFAINSRPYIVSVYETLASLVAHTHIRHPYFSKKTTGPVLIVAVSSSRGLCGSIHAQLIRTVVKYVKAHPSTEFEIIAVGKKMEKISSLLSVPLVASFNNIPDLVLPFHVTSLFELIKKSFEEKKYKKIMIAHSHYASALSYTPTLKQFLPIDGGEVRGVLQSFYKKMHVTSDVRAPSFTFEPSEEGVLDYVLPNILKTKLYNMFLESRACEHSARMVAMKSATENASSLVDELKVTYNKARQEAITREISEIAAGSIQ